MTALPWNSLALAQQPPPDEKALQADRRRVSSRRDLGDHEKALLFELLADQHRYGFCNASWRELAARLGKDPKNVKRALQGIESRYEGLLMIFRAERAPARIIVNLASLPPEQPGLFDLEGQ
jgi:hypothetical protein